MHAPSFTQSARSDTPERAAIVLRATNALVASSLSHFRAAAEIGRDRMRSSDWAFRGDHDMGDGAPGWAIRNEVVTKPQTPPQTQTPVRIKSEGDSKIRSRKRTRIRKRTLIRNV